MEQGSPLTTIALYTDVERNAMFVREAGEAVRIYSAERDPYLDYDVLERALRDSGADARWAGRAAGTTSCPIHPITACLSPARIA